MSRILRRTANETEGYPLPLSGSVIYPTLGNGGGRVTKPHFGWRRAGGVLVLLIDRICNDYLSRQRLSIRCLTGGAVITLVELTAGILSISFLKPTYGIIHLPFHILGQGLPALSALWTLATIPAMGLGRFLRCSQCLEAPIFAARRRQWPKPSRR